MFLLNSYFQLKYSLLQKCVIDKNIFLKSFSSISLWAFNTFKNDFQCLNSYLLRQNIKHEQSALCWKYKANDTYRSKNRTKAEKSQMGNFYQIICVIGTKVKLWFMESAILLKRFVYIDRNLKIPIQAF